jgi:hypothetical protein
VSSEPAHVIEEDGWKIAICYDEEPRGFDEVIPDEVHVETWHPRRVIGKCVPRPRSLEEYTEFVAEIKAEHPNALILPLYAYEHGGITFSLTSYADRFDSGTVGVIWTDCDEYLDKRAALAAVVEDMAALAEGQVYGWVVIDPQGEHKDSRWDYFGRNPEKDGSPLLDDARQALAFWKAEERSGEELVANHFAL